VAWERNALHRLILTKMIDLIESIPGLLASDDAQALLEHVQQDLAAFKHLDFYARDAGAQMTRLRVMLQEYAVAIQPFKQLIKTASLPEEEQAGLLTKLAAILMLIESRQEKIKRLQRIIPQGMLDVKRAFVLASEDRCSEKDTEEKVLKNELASLQTFMSGLNKQYTDLVRQGDSFPSFSQAMTRLHWQQLHEYRARVQTLLVRVQACSTLTPAGNMLHACIKQALNNMPTVKTINRALKLLETGPLNNIGFVAKNGEDTCLYFLKQGKRFFHMPYRDDMYHVDYDPSHDLVATGGNCFGESFMFMHALQAGKCKLSCPELGLINFQLDQSRQLKFGRQTLGEADTVVTAESENQSVQWDDVKHVFLDNAQFKAGDICGLLFSMNEYTKSQRDFIPGHIAVVAKLDTQLSPYKYILFEKNFGAFGVEDDESLAYLIRDVLMPLYEGMSYSKIKLVKFAEASKETYNLLQSIKPLQTVSAASASPDGRKELALVVSGKPSFFSTYTPSSAPQANELVSTPYL